MADLLQIEFACRKVLDTKDPLRFALDGILNEMTVPDSDLRDDFKRVVGGGRLMARNINELDPFDFSTFTSFDLGPILKDEVTKMFECEGTENYFQGFSENYILLGEDPVMIEIQGDYSVSRLYTEKMTWFKQNGNDYYFQWAKTIGQQVPTAETNLSNIKKLNEAP